MNSELTNDERLTAIGLFAEAYAGLTARLAAQLAQHDLGLVEFEVLIRLSRSPHGELRMTDLSAQTSLTTSGVTRVVDRLERDGLARRRACPTDRRSSYAVITDAGRKRLEGVLPGHLALIDEWFTGRIPPEQLTVVLDALRAVRDAVSPGATAGIVPARLSSGG
jgi:MarR family 2-MHQ and catechol resistance regulon transcriptional repressor